MLAVLIKKDCKMKILIDGRSLTPQISGISRYINELTKGYIREYGNDAVSVILNQVISAFPYHYILCPYHRHALCDNIKFSCFLQKLDYDIYHAGDLIGPFWRKKNAIHLVTVHDLMLLKVKNFSKASFVKRAFRKIKFSFFWKRILSEADIVISVSETTKKDVKELLGIASIVFREGINEIKHDSSDRIKLNHDLIPGKYFLYVGLAMPHKNIDFLINTFLHSETDKKLVICGKGHCPIESDRIIYWGWAEDDELDCLYKHCAAFVFPSLYEGFGLPILEALSYHCRVFSSHAASLGEFSDKVISFFNPTDQSQLQYLLEHCDEIQVDDYLVDEYLRHFRWEEIWKEFHQFLKSYIHNGKR